MNLSESFKESKREKRIKELTQQVEDLAAKVLLLETDNGVLKANLESVIKENAILIRKLNSKSLLERMSTDNFMNRQYGL